MYPESLLQWLITITVVFGILALALLLGVWLHRWSNRKDGQ